MSSSGAADMSDEDSSITQVSSAIPSRPNSVKHFPSERTPLITTSEVCDDESYRDGQTKKTPETIIFLLILLLILAATSDSLMEAPVVRIMESVICYRHFEKVDPSKILLPSGVAGPGAIGGVDELYCKDNEVQGQLAMLQGYQMMLDGFPSLLLALPFGWAADRFGRKPLLVLGISSFIFRAAWIQAVLWFWQSFDIRWTWLSTAHALISGSTSVVSALFFTIGADVVAQDDRSAFFSRAGASGLLPSVFIPPISAWLMTYNPWIPALGGTICTALSLLLVFPIPETLDYRHPHSTPSSSHPASPTTESMPAPPDPSTNPAPISSNFATRWLASLRSSSSFLWADWRVPALISTFFLHMLIAQVSQLLLQYISKRYGVKFSTATLVLTIRAAVNCTFLLVILPYITKVVSTQWNLSGQRKDIYLARASLLMVTVGCFLIGASPNISFLIVSLSITCLGAGAMYLIRSFLTSLVPAHHVGRAFSLISIVDTVGSMLGAPLLAALLKRGLAIGGMGIGLPFYFLGLGGAVITVVACLVGMRKGEDDGYYVVEQDEE